MMLINFMFNFLFIELTIYLIIYLPFIQSSNPTIYVCLYLYVDLSHQRIGDAMVSDLRIETTSP